MNLDAIIARAAPPTERVDAGAFEPAETDAESLARRRERLVEAFGSREKMAVHAEALGLSLESWLGRLRDVRLAGPDPDWAHMFRAMFERLSDGPRPFAGFRRWIAAEAKARWPAELPCAPDALEGPLDHLAGVLGVAFQPTYRIERTLVSRPTWATRFQQSPALAYAFGRATADWLSDLVRIVERAAADRALLARVFFGGADPGALVRIEPGLGDPHAGGRSVAILRFERGGVVYKPKDLRIATAVGEIAGRLDGAALAVPAVLTRDGYAWEQVYETHPIAGREEADAFFRALGGWLALLHALNGNDFWFDNLIADGATPRFIDFETAVQPPANWSHGKYRIGEKAAALVGTLPVGTGILPLPMPTRDGQDPTDIGCLSRPGEHRTPLRDVDGGGLLTWRENRFAPRYEDGTPADAADHFDAFEDGYLRAARAFAASTARERIIETLRQFADAPIRIIRIDTWTCYRMVRQSLLPRHLSDGAWREIALHAALPRQRDMVGELREAAVRDLRRLDVPLFQTRLDSRDLLGVEGERLPNFFGQDALSGTEERLRTLAGVAEDDRRAALRSGFSLRVGNPPRRSSTAERTSAARTDDMLAWADEIASGVARRAVCDERCGPTWIGPHHDVFTGQRILSRLGFDVLSGRAGLAEALLELARGLDRPDLAALAREALANAAREFIEHIDALLRFGAGYAIGAGGLVTILARERELRPLAVEIWQAAAAREIWMQSGSDFVSGLAGWREAALALGETAPSRHGPGRPYAPSALARLAVWLDPENASPLCPDRRAAARLRRDFERSGSWFPARWLDDRHNLSGIDGLPALAVRFLRLAHGEAGPEGEGRAGDGHDHPRSAA